MKSVMVKSNNNFIACDNIKVGYAVVFFAASVLYIATCAPGAVWQDSGMLQYRVWHNDIEGGLGLALSHPLFYMIAIAAKYIPVGGFAYRVNITAAVISAAAVANLFLLLRLWLGKNLDALVGAATLALSHTFWRHATVPETYNLYIALLLAELIVLLLYFRTRRIGFLYALGLFNGLAIANHMLASIGFGCYGIVLLIFLLKKQISFKQLVVIVLLWVIGALPYEYLIVKNILQTGDFWATLASAAFGTNWQADVLNVSLSGRIIKENLVLIAYNFPTPNIIFFFAGLYGLKKVSPTRSFANILLALLILFFVFAFRYTVPDRYAFFIPFYCLVCVLISVGFSSLTAGHNRKILRWAVFILVLLPIPTYIIAPVAAEKMQFPLSTRANIPYRNDYTWFLRPWRTGYKGAERFADAALSEVETGAVICADNTTVYPLLYMQEVKGKRTDVKIISKIAGSEGTPTLSEKTIEQWLSEKNFYAVSPIPGHKFERTGVLWKLTE